MELDQLRTFLSLAETKNFSKTAEALHVVQSAISMRLQSLEDQLGRPLFTRNQRKVDLTPLGRHFLPYAERILSVVKEAEMAAEMHERFEDQITVGSTDSMWRHLLRPSLLQFCQENPRTAVSTHTGHSWQVIQKLLDGVIHLGFVYSRPHVPGIEVMSFYEDEIILVSSATHPLMKKAVVHKKDLQQLPFITVEWDGPIKQYIQKILPKGYTPQVHLDQLSMLKVFLRAGAAVGFVPRQTVKWELEKQELAQIKVVDVAPFKRKGYLIYRREKEVRPAIKKWLQILKAQKFTVKAST